jgi:hypothetical protein
MNEAHPSMLALDLAALGGSDPVVERHVASCQECRARVQASAPSPEPVPVWVTAAPRPAPWSLRWLVPALVAAVAAVVVVTRSEPPSSTRAKGQPSFALYVERGGVVRLWDGQQPVFAGDRLQLKVAASGFDSLQVGVAASDGGWRVVYQGAVDPAAETVLPESWVVDEADPSLRLGFLLCDGGCPEGEVARAATAAPRDARRWWSEFTMTRSSR